MLQIAIDAARVLAATPSPSPSPVSPPPELVTPGFGGFIIVALLVVAVIALVWDMQRRIRRTRYRAEIDAQLDAEQQAKAAEEASNVDDQFVDAADSDDGASTDDPDASPGRGPRQPL